LKRNTTIIRSGVLGGVVNTANVVFYDGTLHAAYMVVKEPSEASAHGVTFQTTVVIGIIVIYSNHNVP